MRIEAIAVANFQGMAQFAAEITAPIVIFCGPNKAGKSTLRDAIELALTGTPRRVDKKKDLDKLVHDGAKVGNVRVKFAGDGAAVFTVPTGDWKQNVLHGRDPAQLAIALDAQRFAALSPEDRRRFLFDATDVPTKPEDISARMVTMPLDLSKVAAITPMLQAGFAAAEGEARGLARDAKSAWRVVTGETYGTQKAVDWKADGGAFDQADLDAVNERLTAARAELETAQQAVGAHDSARKAYEDAMTKRNALKARADGIAQAVALVDRAKKDVDEFRPKVEKLREEAKTEGQPTTPCPHCGAALRIQAGAIVAADTAAPPVDLVTKARLAEHESSLAMLERALANRQTVLGATEAAVEDLRKLVLPTPPGDLPPATAPFKAKILALEEQRDALVHARVRFETAQAKTDDAAKHHDDVKGWSAIADVLAPDGLPAQLLAEAIKPINEACALAARLAKWATPMIGDDMSITSDGREYALLSESEKWRVDAIFAAAFAAELHTGILLLDRFDVLDIPSRGQAITMLRAVREVFELDSVLLFGTLKQMPEKLPSGVAAVWLGPQPVAVRAAA